MNIYFSYMFPYNWVLQPSNMYLNYELRSDMFEIKLDLWDLSAFTNVEYVSGLTMLLWWALVISSMRPTRSVVDTPWVLLHSLKKIDFKWELYQTLAAWAAEVRMGLPVPARLLHFFICVFPIHSKSDVIWGDTTTADSDHNKAGISELLWSVLNTVHAGPRPNKLLNNLLKIIFPEESSDALEPFSFAFT